MYSFKLVPEAVRAGAFAFIVFGATLLVNFNLNTVADDWKSYATAAVSGGIAAAGAAALAVLTRSR